MIKYTVPRQLPLPPRYHTTLECDLCGYFLSAMPFENNGYIVDLNIVDKPYNNTFSVLPNSNPAATAVDPSGLISLFNIHAYGSYRVYKSAIKFKLFPSLGADNLGVCIVPAEAGQTLTYPTARAMPYAKEMNFGFSQNNKYLSNMIGVPKLAGITARALQDDQSGQFNGDLALDPIYKCYWQIYVANLNQMLPGQPAAQVGYECKLKIWVEFFNLQNASLYQ